MKKLFKFLCVSIIFVLAACQDDEIKKSESPETFALVDDIDLGEAGAAEISAYDPSTKQLFVVNNAVASKIDVVDFQDVTMITYLESIDVSIYGSAVQSVAVKNGLLAAAIQGTLKTDDGKIVIFNTSDLSEEAVITVGALPDMVTFSPDGKLIISANEGEPSDDYLIDPVGSVSIISVEASFAVSTLTFAGFNASAATLATSGYRVFGPNADLSEDTEPEYVAISKDSKTAWVSLQENNGIAKIDLTTKVITDIFPLGYKDFMVNGNDIDASDKDNLITLANWPVKGMYQPDALASFTVGGINYVVSANEGDVREYAGLNEKIRVGSLALDATVFPNSVDLKLQPNLGRLNVTNTKGDTDIDSDYDALYTFGARSFSIWNGNTGALVFDSGNDLEERVIISNTGMYDDLRSDDKGVEPEGVTIGKMGNRYIAFICLERADAVVLYDVTDPTSPEFLKLLQTGDAPEGVIFVPASESPNNKSMLIVSSEDDGMVKVFQPSEL